MPPCWSPYSSRCCPRRNTLHEGAPTFRAARGSTTREHVLRFDSAWPLARCQSGSCNEVDFGQMTQSSSSVSPQRSARLQCALLTASHPFCGRHFVYASLSGCQCCGKRMDSRIQSSNVSRPGKATRGAGTVVPLPFHALSASSLALVAQQVGIEHRLIRPSTQCPFLPFHSPPRAAGSLPLSGGVSPFQCALSALYHPWCSRMFLVSAKGHCHCCPRASDATLQDVLAAGQFSSVQLTAGETAVGDGLGER